MLTWFYPPISRWSVRVRTGSHWSWFLPSCTHGRCPDNEGYVNAIPLFLYHRGAFECTSLFLPFSQKEVTLCASSTFISLNALYYGRENSHSCDLKSFLAFPRQETHKQPHPTNWMVLGLLQTHRHQRRALLVVYKRVVHPAEHEKWPKILTKHLNCANRTLAPPTPCAEMELMNLCLVEIKGTKNTPAPPSPPAKKSWVKRHNNTGEK